MARYVTLHLRPGADARSALCTWRDQLEADERTVVGLGASLVEALGQSIPALRTSPSFTGPGIDVPSTPASIWCWLRGADRGDLVHATRRLADSLASAFEVEQVIDAFRHGSGRDLTGYEDGTENPTGDDAVAAGICSSDAAGLSGSSFVAVQQWVHDLTRFEAMPQPDRDHVIGRRLQDNEELDDAPTSAHVKRTAQESFEPEAFILRRSMPWADADRAGLVFVAFGHSFDAFEAQLRRMVGAEDGITDALFRFTRPITGAYYWCPPVADGRLDLRGLGF